MAYTLGIESLLQWLRGMERPYGHASLPCGRGRHGRGKGLRLGEKPGMQALFLLSVGVVNCFVETFFSLPRSIVLPVCEWVVREASVSGSS
jgi:hypothetical protein